MGIQDRDYYWKDREQRDGRKNPDTSISGFSPSAERPGRSFLWRFLSLPWLIPFFLGIALGRSWDSLGRLFQALYERFLF